MDGMPLNLIVSQGIFCVLFVWLLIKTQKESGIRESKLYEQINEQNKTLKQQSESIQRIAEGLERLEMRFEMLAK